MVRQGAARRSANQKPYSARVQQRHRLQAAPSDCERPLTCANDPERPRRREFASRWSGFKSSAPGPSVLLVTRLECVKSDWSDEIVISAANMQATVSSTRQRPG